MIEGEKKHLLFIDNREKDVRNHVTQKMLVSITYFQLLLMEGIILNHNYIYRYTMKNKQNSK